MSWGTSRTVKSEHPGCQPSSVCTASSQPSDHFPIQSPTSIAFPHASHSPGRRACMTFFANGAPIPACRSDVDRRA